MSLQHIGIFGPGQSGKTTLAKATAYDLAKNHGFGTLVLDPNGDDWKSALYSTKNEADFWPVVWSSYRCVVVVEEATETIARNKDLTGLFTRVRHRGHKLMIVGHSGTNLLPLMREQIHFLHLFRTSEQAAKIWAETMAEDRLMLATSLRRYEFVRCIQFGNTDGSNLVEKCKLKI